MPQRDLMDVLRSWLLHRRVEPQLEGTLPAGIAWTILPTFSYNPVYGFAFGASVSGGGTLGKGPDARPTSVVVSANYSTTGQLQAQFKGDIFSAGGNYLIKADVRYLDTNRATWGLGPITPGQQEYPMDFKLARWYGTPTLRCFGLLATSGTVQSRLFEAKLEPQGLTILTCEPSVQDTRVMEAIYAVKKGESPDRPRHLIREAAAHLLDRGAQAVIAGCTEIPLILREGDLPVPVIDPTWNLARAAVRCALAAGPQFGARRSCYKDRG